MNGVRAVFDEKRAVELCLEVVLMKSSEVLYNPKPDLACRNVWLKSEKVSLFLADGVFLC